MSIQDNGITLENINQLVAAIQGDASLAKVRFAAKSKWLGGAQSEVTVSEITAGGQTISRPDRHFTMRVDEPPQLGGADAYPNPIEYLAAGLCGCITAGIATNAALFKTQLDKIEIEVEMDYDLSNVLALDRHAPGNVTELRYKVILKGPGPADALAKAKQTIDGKSPVRNTLEQALKVVRTEVVIEP